MSVVVKIPPGRLGAFIKGSVRKNADAIKRGVRNGLVRGKSHLVRQTPVDQGILKNAWKVIVADGGMPALLNDAPHAGIVERGARPHMPPLEPILEWVKRHLRSFGIRAPRFKTKMGPLTKRAMAGSNARFARHLQDVDEFEHDVLAIAEAIRWKIFNHGQAGTFFVRNSLPALRDFVAQEIDRAIAKALANQADD